MYDRRQHRCTLRYAAASGLRRVCLAAVLCALSFGGAFAAPDAQQGKALARQCAGCHGAEGVSVAPNVPNLAGQRYPYLIGQLDAFKAQTRHFQIMNTVVTLLTQPQLEDMAAYFASLQPGCAGVPAAGGKGKTKRKSGPE